MVVKIIPNDKAQPAGKLADAELHFTDGVFDGLMGTAKWRRSQCHVPGSHLFRQR